MEEKAKYPNLSLWLVLSVALAIVLGQVLEQARVLERGVHAIEYFVAVLLYVPGLVKAFRKRGAACWLFFSTIRGSRDTDPGAFWFAVGFPTVIVLVILVCGIVALWS